MTTIQNSPFIEDQYIVSLAGMQSGKNIISWSDKKKAYAAQKHPVINQLASTIIGALKGGTYTLMLASVNPIINSSMRAQIFGGITDVCQPCGSYMASLSKVKLLNNLMIHLQLDSENPSSNPFLSFLRPLAIQGKSTFKCLSEDWSFQICRGVNYIGGIWDTLSEKWMLTGAIAVVIGAMCTLDQLNTFALQERQAARDLKNDLCERFKKVATRLSTLEDNQEIQKCAQEILKRQFTIQKDVESLQLPHLTWNNIVEMTQPVFEAARKIQQNNRSEVVEGLSRV